MKSEPEFITWKRRAAEAWHEKVAAMTPQEREEYYKELNSTLLARIQELKSGASGKKPLAS